MAGNAPPCDGVRCVKKQENGALLWFLVVEICAVCFLTPLSSSPTYSKNLKLEMTMNEIRRRKPLPIHAMRARFELEIGDMERAS